MDSEQAAALSQRCEDSARTQTALSRETTRVGPFVALIEPGDDLIWLNYAMPVEPLPAERAALAALAELRGHFASRGRRLRFEFHAAPWPGLPALLERAGLTLQARHPMMVCTPASLRPVAAPHVAVQLLQPHSPDADLAAYIGVQRAGFGESAGEVGPERVAWLRNALRAGYEQHALASLAGVPAGAGAMLPFAGVGELAGVATLPAMRRRGVAATLSAYLTAGLFATGGDLAWLSAGDDIAAAVYAKVGYSLIDHRLNYIEP